MPLLTETKEQDYVEYDPIHYPPVWLEELRQTEARLCQVQHWTYVGEQDGRDMLSSLKTGTVEAGLVYLAVHKKQCLEGKEIPDYEEWLKGLGANHNESANSNSPKPQQGKDR